MTAARAEFLKYEQDLIEKGIEKGLREGVRLLCEALAIDLDEGRRRHIDSLDAAGLRALFAKLKLQRRWPA